MVPGSLSGGHPVTAQDKQRLFLALWPPEVVQATLGERARQAVGRRRGRILPAANLHITLAFLGDTAPADGACYELMADTLVGLPAFDLTLDRLVGHRRRGMLWAAPTEMPSELAELARLTGEVLRPCGRVPESRPFRAHVTLARKVTDLEAEAAMAPVTWPVTQLALVASHRTPKGAEYRTLRRWPLHRQA